MTITEEQHIEFIISKIDILLEQSKVGNTRDALVAIMQKQLTDDERRIFFFYFYKLYKGYTKYRHINILIDYYKLLEKLVENHNDQKDNTIFDTSEANKILTPELEMEVLDIEKTNSEEMIKLKAFFARVIILLFGLGIFVYLILLLSLSKDSGDLFIALAKLF